MAVKPVELPMGIRQKIASMTNTRKIQGIGVFVVSFTFRRYLPNGRAPSLAIAKAILEVTVKLLKPAKNKLIMSNDVIARAPALLNVRPSLEVNAIE
jgi:hypothetical protein